jgi:hypothetical protein
MLPKKQISILAGASGSGKTTLTVQAIQACQKGQPFPLEFQGKRFAYLVADRTKDEVDSRVQKLGVETELYGIADDENFNEQLLINDPFGAFRKAILHFKKPYDVLIIDPIGIFMEGNAIDYKQTAVSLIRFNRFAAEKNITVMACHHASKKRTDFTFSRPQDRILGSAAFQGYSGTQMILIQGTEDGEDYDTFVQVPHMTPATTTFFKRREDGYFNIFDPSLPPLLRDFKSGTVFDTQTILHTAENIGVARRTAFNMLDTASKRGSLIKLERGRYQVP